MPSAGQCPRLWGRRDPGKSRRGWGRRGRWLSTPPGPAPASPHLPGALRWGPSLLPAEGHLREKTWLGTSGSRCEVVLPLTLSRSYVRMSLGWRVPVARCLVAPGRGTGTGKGRADVPAGFNRSEMNLDVLKTHLAFQQQVGASTGGCARNRLMPRRGNGRSRRDSACCGHCGTSPHGKPEVSPPGEGGQTPRGPTAPFPSLPPGVYMGPPGPGPCAAGTGGAGEGTLVAVCPPEQLSPFPAAPAPRQDTGQTRRCALGAGGDTLLLAANSDFL